jgi:hypothetical protein
MIGFWSPNAADEILGSLWQLTIAVIAVIDEAVGNQATTSETLIKSDKHPFEAS